MMAETVLLSVAWIGSPWYGPSNTQSSLVSHHCRSNSCASSSV
jgi:hypothetical protein